MKSTCLLLAGLLVAGGDTAFGWRLERVDAPGPIETIETIGDEVWVATDQAWFLALVAPDGRVSLAASAPPRRAPVPADALPDGRVATGRRDVVKAWLAEPTRRYDHAVLGDAVEAAALVIELRGGRRVTVRLDEAAVFEDLEPRIADLNGDGQDEVVVVKSYLQRGAALAIVGESGSDYAIVTETPAIGRPHRWLNPAGIADFDGDGATDIALVQMPHAVGRLELWTWRSGDLQRTAQLADTSNHAIGTRVLQMSAVADFDGDGILDLALPSFDRHSIRLIAFAPLPREIARLPLQARAVTEFGRLHAVDGSPVIVVGLDGGTLVAVRR